MIAINVKAKAARHLPDKETFSKQDPYCILFISAKYAKKKTPTHNNGGNGAKWEKENSFNFIVNDIEIDLLTFKVMNENSLTDDSIIGFGTLPISDNTKIK